MVDMKDLVSLCKRRGIIFQSSEVYGGVGSVWDYGPVGVELKNNVKRAWWKANVYSRSDMVGLDASILMHPKTWEASGHVASFADLLVDCKKCKKRFREDKLKGKKCPECGGGLTDSRRFNLMFKTAIGSVEGQSTTIHLRPETAQGIFLNFPNVLNASRKKLPFGIAQTGKAFRNEITTGNFTFRCREFEQMEIEYFVRPEEDQKWYDYWVNERFNWYINLGIDKKNLKLRPHEKDELAHYAKSCHDIEYNFPFGWSELEGIANRTDFDLKQHALISGKELVYFDEETKKNIVPYVIEPSGGVDRAVLAFLIDSYNVEKVKSQKRTVLKLHKDLAPIKAAVFPLLRNRPEIVEMAQKIVKDLAGDRYVVYDDTASIGRLYRRQDEIGTPYCITVDVQSLDDKKVTVRDRDSMEQDRISADKLESALIEKLKEA
ncbi:MAG: glycine--tRNA ligase [Candidatus Omnitrophica bacterium]|nr:glycine--tRNA ligase [Candidatus Omnitrophota bacterium]